MIYTIVKQIYLLTITELLILLQPGDGYDTFAPWGYYNTQPADLGAAYGPPVGYHWALPQLTV